MKHPHKLNTCLATRLINNTNLPNGCWLWTAARNSSGYGNIRIDGRIESSHRTSWVTFNGPIPIGLQVLHHCDEPSCINPDHLFLGTQQNNIDDCKLKHRRRRKLNLNLVRAIRADNRGQAILAKIYGVCQSNVSQIKSRKIWGWID